MPYQIVTMTEDGEVTTYAEDLTEWAEANFTEITGVSSNPRTRAELQGHPVLFGFIGPCWGGWTDDGEAIIRYEDGPTYRAMV